MREETAVVVPAVALNPEPEILDFDGVASLLCVEVSYVREKTRARCPNPIPSHSIGTRLRFFRSEVLLWLKSQPSERPKRRYRLTPGAKKKLIQRNKQRAGMVAA